MGRKTGLKNKKPEVDIELNSYEPSESDDDYNNNERLMLQRAAKRRSKVDEDEDEESEEEVFRVHDSGDDDDDDDADPMEPLGEEMDSDIEGKEDGDGLPDGKAWGTKRKSYYGTDYVDQDYGGFSKAEEEEAALLEEEEARATQTRLLAELEDADFFGTIPTKSTQKKSKDIAVEDEELSEVIKTDVSKLTKREKLALLEKESPEFMGLISDFKERMAYAKDNLEPVLILAKSGEIPDCAALKFVSTKYHLILNYCTNIAFYLLLKSKRVRVTNHPVVKRLVQYHKLLEEMDPIDEQLIKPQILEILSRKEKGKKLKIVQPAVVDPTILTGNRAQRRKIQQELKEAQDENNAKKQKTESFEEIQEQGFMEETGDEKDMSDDETEKRAITYEIAKNKGLTPKRKKEDRNPRVKHRNKYRKATIRRKGQVRGVYKEAPRYDGEPFGIKASVSKSIKLK